MKKARNVFCRWRGANIVTETATPSSIEPATDKFDAACLLLGVATFGAALVGGGWKMGQLSPGWGFYVASGSIGISAYPLLMRFAAKAYLSQRETAFSPRLASIAGACCGAAAPAVVSPWASDNWQLFQWHAISCVLYLLASGMFAYSTRSYSESLRCRLRCLRPTVSLETRRAASRKLAASPIRKLHQKALARLLQSLRDEDSVRLSVLEALANADERIHAAVVPLLADGSHEVRRQAAIALEATGWQPANEVELAAKCVALRDWPAAVTVGGKAVPLLAKVAGGADRDIALCAVEALSRIPDPAASRALAAALAAEDNAGWDVEFRIGVISKLEVLKEPSASGPLKRIVRDSSQCMTVRLAAATALNRIGWRPADDQARVFSRVADRRWSDVAAMGSPASGPLREIAMGDDGDAANAAIQCLAEIGAPAVDSLISLLQHDPVSRTAQETLVALAALSVPRLLDIVSEATRRGKNLNEIVRGASRRKTLPGLAKDVLLRIGQANPQPIIARLDVASAPDPLIVELLKSATWRHASDVERLRWTLVRRNLSEVKAFGELAREPLQVMLGSDDPAIRLFAMESLTAIGHANCETMLRDALNDEDVKVRLAAIAGLSAHGDPATVLTWVFAAQHALQSPFEVWTVANIAKCLKKDYRVFGELLELPDVEKRLCAITMLGQCGNQRAARYLLPVALDARRAERIPAAMALKQIGWRSKDPAQRVQLALACNDWDELDEAVKLLTPGTRKTTIAELLRHALKALDDPLLAFDSRKAIASVLMAHPSSISATHLKRVIGIKHVFHEYLDDSAGQEHDKYCQELEELSERFTHSDELPITGITRRPDPERKRSPLDLSLVHDLARKELSRRSRTSK